MLVDTSRSSEKLRINIDIILHKMPCSILGLDVQDIMGTTTLNVRGTLVKKSLDSMGNIMDHEVEVKRDSRINIIIYFNRSREWRYCNA
jgi:hypothetical protein